MSGWVKLDKVINEDDTIKQESKMDLSKVRILINESTYRDAEHFFREETCLESRGPRPSFKLIKSRWYYIYITLSGHFDVVHTDSIQEKDPFLSLTDELKAEIKRRFPKADKVEMDKEKYLKVLAENEKLKKKWGDQSIHLKRNLEVQDMQSVEIARLKTEQSKASTEIDNLNKKNTRLEKEKGEYKGALNALSKMHAGLQEKLEEDYTPHPRCCCK